MLKIPAATGLTSAMHLLRLLIVRFLQGRTASLTELVTTVIPTDVRATQINFQALVHLKEPVLTVTIYRTIKQKMVRGIYRVYQAKSSGPNSLMIVVLQFGRMYLPHNYHPSLLRPPPPRAPLKNKRKGRSANTMLSGLPLAQKNTKILKRR